MKRHSQGLWVVTPDGKTLGFHYHTPKAGDNWPANQKRWADDTAVMIREALKEAGPLPPREAKDRPDEALSGRGSGTGADGSVRAAVSVVEVRNGRHEGPPVVDSVYFDADQWKAYLPPKEAKVGAEWTIPEDAATRFAPGFSPLTDAIFSPRPADVTKATVTAKLERVADGVTVVRYAGTWETLHHRDNDPKLPIRTTAAGEGVGVVDTKSGKLTAMLWLIPGTFRNSPPGDQPRRTIAVVEWADKD